MTPINPQSVSTRLLGGTQAPGKVSPAGADRSAEGGSFQNLLIDSLKHVNGMQAQADQAVEQLFTGGDVNPAEVLTAVQKADMAFRLTMQVRNKLMDVYREVQEIRI